MKYDLLFERFLNPERITMPDIDVDFEDTRREEVIEYCMNKYGLKRVALIVTFGTLAAKQAIKDICRTLDIDQKKVDNLSKLLDSKLSLKQNYQKSIFVEELADLVHMAPSTFFRHFKALIGLTPMQYHKQLRLYAARKLLWQPGASVSSAAYTVGYESPSQFARDYKKIFGRTPSEEIGLQRQHSSSA